MIARGRFKYGVFYTGFAGAKFVCHGDFERLNNLDAVFHVFLKIGDGWRTERMGHGIFAIKPNLEEIVGHGNPIAVFFTVNGFKAQLFPKSNGSFMVKGLNADLKKRSSQRNGLAF